MFGTLDPMNDKQKRILIVAVMAALVALGWFFRYDFQVVASGDRFGLAYMLNRWTGTVHFFYPTGRRELHEAVAPSSQTPAAPTVSTTPLDYNPFLCTSKDDQSPECLRSQVKK